MFDRRTGLTPTVYGQNEGGTQSRTAEETQSKSRAAMSRVEYQQKQVVDWQSRVAQSEAFVARWFVQPDDVAQFMGPAGAIMWQRDVMSSDVELVVRQFQYTISAASIRRPNRDRDIGNYQQVMSLFAPTLAEVGGSTGNWDSWNGMVAEWARLHDANLDHLMIRIEGDPEAEAKQQQMQEMMLEAQLQELQAKTGKLQAEAQSTMTDVQMKPMEMQAAQAMDQSKMQSEQMKLQGEQMKQQGEMAKMQMEAQIKQTEAEMKQRDMELSQQIKQAEAMFSAQASEQARASKALEDQMQLVLDMQKHDQEMEQDQEVHEQEMVQKSEAADADLKVKKAQASAAAKAKPATKPAAKKKGTK